MTRTVYKPELMKQLFELGCTYSGEEISLTKLLGQLQDAGNVTTLASYLTTLSEAQMLAGLQKYASDSARKYNSVPKLMVYNTALLSALARRRCVAVEVKSGSRTAGRGLSKFAAAFHPVHSLVVGTGGVPLEEFLSWDLSALFE